MRLGAKKISIKNRFDLHENEGESKTLFLMQSFMPGLNLIPVLRNIKLLGKGYRATFIYVCIL